MPYRNKKKQANYFRKYNAGAVRKRKIKDKCLQRMYGIGLAEYERMSASQGWVCAVCRQPEKTKRLGVLRQLCVDHNHKTGKVRELLCASCNTAIGYVQDNPLLAQALTNYLIKHESNV